MPKKVTEIKSRFALKPQVAGKSKMFQAKKINEYLTLGIGLIKKISTVQVLVVLLIVTSFLLGVLITKNQYLEKEKAAGLVAAKLAQQQTQAQTPQPPAPTKIDLTTLKKIFGNKDVIKFGDANNKNLIVEVADPSCPYCHVAAGLNPELNAQMGPQFTLVANGGTYIAPVPEIKKLLDSGQASFAYIYFPGHGNGEIAMQALYCANEQGKFWEAHNKLMTNEGYNLINNDVQNSKANIGKIVDFLANTLDSQTLSSCLESGKYFSYLASDQQLATDVGADRGTPNFFVNEANFTGAYSWSDMKSAVK
jgi:protein-disulfide isomerase